jgi:hypothetical protein
MHCVGELLAQAAAKQILFLLNLPMGNGWTLPAEISYSKAEAVFSWV